MVVSVQDPILIKIDADIEGARRKLVQLKKEFKEVSSSRASAEARSRFNPRDIKIRVPEDHPRSRRELPPRPSLRDGLGALAHEGATAFRIGDAFAKAMTRTFPVISGPFLAMDLAYRGVSKSRSTTLGPVLDRFQEDLNELKNLQTLSPGGMELGRLNPEGIKKNADALRNSINDAVVGVEEALKKSAQGIQALRRPNEGAIPDSLIGRVNVAEFEALRDALGDISEVVKDPKLQQQIENVLKRQEFIFRTGREPGRARPDGLGRALPDERIDPRPLKSSFLDLGGGAGLDRLDRELTDAGSRVEDLSTGFGELTQAAGGLEAQGGALAELLGRTNVLFGEQSGLLGELGVQLPELGREFTTLLERTSQEAGTLNDVVEEVGRSFLDAFEGAIQRGESLSGVLKGLALDVARLAAQRGANTRRSVAASAPPADARPPALAMAA